MTMRSPMILAALMAVTAFSCPAPAAAIESALVARSAPDTLTVTWQGRDPIDVYVAERPDATIAEARLVSPGDTDGRHVIDAAGTARRYILLRDTKSGDSAIAAERLVPLEHGSNFRDIGGYPAAGGKHVRWGMIYRSGATPLLTDADVGQIKALGLRNLIDLRSSEERALAPSRIEGVPYSAVGYSMMTLMPAGGRGQITNGSAVYRNLPALLAPQLRLIFADLLRNEAPIAYNCSAGQDRTGFVTAMLLSALGVPRDVILTDYQLSTALRRPEYEMPRIDAAANAGNPTALFFAKYQQNPAAAKPKPLLEADGTPFLNAAFVEIETRWGSVDAYLEQQAGLTAVARAALRATYLR